MVGTSLLNAGGDLSEEERLAQLDDLLTPEEKKLLADARTSKVDDPKAPWAERLANAGRELDGPPQSAGEVGTNEVLVYLGQGKSDTPKRIRGKADFLRAKEGDYTWYVLPAHYVENVIGLKP